MTMKVMVSFPDEFLLEVDRVAREEHRSRSELVREAIRLYLKTRQDRGKPGNDPLLGMFADEPEIMDQVIESALMARESHPLRSSVDE